MKDTKVKILSFGEIILDVYKDKTVLGGAPFNFAFHASKLGAKVWLVSAVGNDVEGRDSLSSIKKSGVNCDYVCIDDNPTGKCFVALDQNGVPDFRLQNCVAYDNIKIDERIFQGNYDALSFGTLALRSENNFDAIKSLLKNCKISNVYCDLNLREPYVSEKSVSFCLKNANILKVTCDELKYVIENILKLDYNGYDQAANLVFDSFSNIKQIVLTCGEDGAYAYLRDKWQKYFQPAKRVTVVSTVGAGDSFGAAYLVSYLRNSPITECLKTATEVSASVISNENNLINILI